MAIGRISGPMLFNNLERQGVDLAFQSNLLYLDVTNLRVGIQNSSPAYILDTPGNVKLANIIIEGNSVTSNTGKIDFGTTANITISGGLPNYVLYTDGAGNLNWGEISTLDSSWGNILLANNTISITNLDGNLDLSANGTGKVNVTNDFYVNGNLYAANFSGNLAGNGATFSGNVVAEWIVGNVQAYILDSYLGNITNLYSDNFSSPNIIITGGTISNINAQINNFSSSNILITGGEVSNVNAQINSLSSANVLLTGGIIYNVDLQANNFSTANAVITGGDISNVNAQINNFSTANAVITGGDISNVNAQINNFSTANALVTGGVIYNVDLQANSFSTANALVTGGIIYNVDLQANNFSTANALVSGGDISNVNAQINNLSSGNVMLNGGVLYNIDLQANNFSTANALMSGGVLYNIDLQANNFSTANALVSGGDISNVNAQINNLSSGNVLISGGVVYNIDLQANNFSTANAFIYGGVIYDVNFQANNFSTANALVLGGEVSNINAQINNLSSGNVLIEGGIISNVNLQANNFSTANALVTGGNVTANISGNITATFGDFSGNILANWFIGNVDAAHANFSDEVFVNANITTSGNLIASGNIITQKITSPIGDLYISAGTEDPNNVVIFDSVSAFLVPTGNAAQRPGNPYTGYVRFNTDIGSIEWWTGLSWTSSNQGVNYQTIVPDGVSNAYTLDYESSDAGILVSINGTTQQPGTSYGITGGTTITFSEIPLTTDIIEIRFLSAGLVAASYAGGSVTGNVNILSNVESSSTTTGALTVIGGAGIAGNINVGGNVGVNSTSGTPSNTASPASWLKVYVSGTAYYLPLYQ